MAVGRLYSVNFLDVAVVAAQDLINLTATANMAFEVLRIEGSQRSLTAWESKPVKLVRNLSVVTAGSGGTAPTPVKINNGDAAATFTARVNDTVAQTGTTSTILFSSGFEFLNGYFKVFTPDERLVIAPSQGFAINMPTAPSASTLMSFSVLVRELF